MLDTLGHEGHLFIPRKVLEEIEHTDDELRSWIKKCKIPVHEEDPNVAKCLGQIFEANPLHKYLVDNIKQRSLADPWVIAHALNTNAIVVTKENYSVLPDNSNRIKIPHVCKNMGIPFMNDFEFVADVGITFTCVRT